jgi:threonine/homoserine/homoserine lactone efflux protein
MTLADLTPLAMLALVHLLAAMSPGATFLVISRQALSSGRASAAMGALACGLGALPWAIAAVAGLALVLEQAQWLYALLKLLGGFYLLYLATLVWRHAADPIAPPQAGATARPVDAFREAFVTQIANPKVAGFFASIFVTVLPASPPLWLIAAILINVFLVEAVWYLCVAVLFSAARSRAAYVQAKPTIDRLMAGLLAVFGLKLLADARG